MKSKLHTSGHFDYDVECSSLPPSLIGSSMLLLLMLLILPLLLPLPLPLPLLLLLLLVLLRAPLLQQRVFGSVADSHLGEHENWQPLLTYGANTRKLKHNMGN